jgi:hypothetical protein
MGVFFAKSVPAGQALKFSVSGEGSAPREAQGAGPGTQSGAPGGGLGAPIDAPAPLASSSAYIVGGLIAVMAGVAFWLALRSRASKAQLVGANTGSLVSAFDAGAREDSSPQPSSRPTPASKGILDALKEELFQLESDWLHESISQQEYEKQKAGLDALLRRQMNIPGQSQGK